jgi:predicted O-linked N-acetylglucosamine transferase (SPINDLY family)
MTELASGWQALRESHPGAARELAALHLAGHPTDAEAWLLLAAAWRAQGRPCESEALFRHAAMLAPERADLPLNLGNLLRGQGRLDEALTCHREAVALAPGAPACQLALCETLLQAGQPAAAQAQAEAALAAQVDSAELRQALGNARFSQGDYHGALATYAEALRLAPGLASLLYNSALTQVRLGQPQAACDSLRRLLASQPDHLNARIKLADLLKELGENIAAEQAYRAALAIKSDLAEVHNNLGATLARLGRWREAVDSYRECLRLGLREPVVLMNLGNAQQSLRDLDAALAAYREGLALAPDHLPLITEAVHVQQKLCDWSGFDQLRPRLLDPALRWQGGETPPSPFVFVALPVDITPAEQLTIARNYARQYPPQAALPAQTRRAQAGPLRIGYVSADYHNHATAHLMLGLFRRHDRQAMSVHAYSLGPDDGSDYRQRIVADCDSFNDVAHLSDRAIAERIRADGIDILVDLKGYTGSARPGLFAWRPAPLQVQWLGYPGTMGADFIDYIVADRTVLPEADLAAYSEAPIWLPDSYQVNDRDQAIAATAPSRAECGLPEDAFVFCCFNSPYKIDPRAFSAWMELLGQVPGSVLWLYSGNPTANRNLQLEAARHGIAGDRLVFAPALAKPLHLARHRHADLFLDTLYYNAHTTASDALWAGVPVVTTPGRTFASRVAASLLKAVDMEEMIMPDLPSYVARALALARDPAALAALKARLLAGRAQARLFDTDRFARALDAAYLAIWRRHREGLAPAPLDVAPT